jgi:hypothetical protein
MPAGLAGRGLRRAHLGERLAAVLPNASDGANVPGTDPQWVWREGPRVAYPMRVGQGFPAR